MDDSRCAVRKGRALLAGLLRCGKCGRKLRVNYNRKSSAMYRCDGDAPRGTNVCLSFGAKYVDQEVGRQLCRAMEPLAIDAAERAFELEQQQRHQEVEQAQLRVEAAQYAADRAFEQYDLTDPKNRLVVDNLEKRLNDKLADLQSARCELQRRLEDNPPLTAQQRDEIRNLSRDFRRLWNHPDTPTALCKQLLRIAIREIVVRRDNGQLAFIIHWAGDTCTEASVNKRATPVASSSRTDPSLTELVRRLAQTLGDGQIARILNMKKLRTPRDLKWTQDRVRSFRSAHGIKKAKTKDDPNILTGQQARDYLGIGYHGLTALVRRGVIRTNQVTDFAPWRIPRAQLDSKTVQRLVNYLKETGHLPPEGGSPPGQREIFVEKTATP
jgi:hypothetical protein